MDILIHNPLSGNLNTTKITIMKKVFTFFALALMFSPFAVADQDNKEKLNDGEILRVVITAIQGEIESGTLATKRAMNKQVRAFANHMNKERANLSKEANVLVNKLKKTSEENIIHKDLKADSKKTLDQLRKLSGSEFDKAYMDVEIKQNQELIDLADSTWVPKMKDESVKALLTKVRPALAANIELAKTIQSSILNNL